MSSWMLDYADRRTAVRKARGTYRAVLERGGSLAEARAEAKAAVFRHLEWREEP